MYIFCLPVYMAGQMAIKLFGMVWGGSGRKRKDTGKPTKLIDGEQEVTHLLCRVYSIPNVQIEGVLVVEFPIEQGYWDWLSDISVRWGGSRFPKTKDDMKKNKK